MPPFSERSLLDLHRNRRSSCLFVQKPAVLSSQDSAIWNDAQDENALAVSSPGVRKTAKPICECSQVGFLYASCQALNLRCTPSCPLHRGLSAKLTGGCIDKQFYRPNGAIANLHKPPASAALRQPPIEGGTGVQCKSQFAEQIGREHFLFSVCAFRAPLFQIRMPPCERPSFLNYDMEINRDRTTEIRPQTPMAMELMAP